jgi:hypothetical protein
MENANSLVCNLLKVHTRPFSASDFLDIKSPKTWKFPIKKNILQVKPILSIFYVWMKRNKHIAIGNKPILILIFDKGLCQFGFKKLQMDNLESLLAHQGAAIEIKGLLF